MDDFKRDLYDDGWHYDLLMPGPNDVPFYRRQAERYGQPVLELACGTGRLTVPLGESGVDITGLDVSPAMLTFPSTANFSLYSSQVTPFPTAWNERMSRLAFVASGNISHAAAGLSVEADEGGRENDSDDHAGQHEFHDVEQDHAKHAASRGAQRDAHRKLARTCRATLLTVFGLLSRALAAVGLYGVMAYAVNRRGARSASACPWAREVRMSSARSSPKA